MKKIICFIMMLMPAMSVMAQEESKEEFSLAKKWELRADGGINWGVGKMVNEDRTGMATIGAMYHFTKNWSLGLNAGGLFREGYHYTNGVPVLPTISYRFLGHKRLSPYVEAYGGYNFPFGKASKIEDAHADCPNSKFGIVGARLGLEWAIWDRFGIRGAFNYNWFLDHGTCNVEPNANKYPDLNKIGFNLGAYIILGKCHKKKAEPIVEPVAPVIEPVFKEVVDTIWYDDVEYVDECDADMKWTIFYDIRISEFNDPDSKLAEIATFLANHKECKVDVKSYADRGTGNKELNIGYSKARSEKAVAALKGAGVTDEMLTVNYYGDSVQPFAENDKNRCTIITATGIKPNKKAVKVRKSRTEVRKVRVN